MMDEEGKNTNHKETLNVFINKREVLEEENQIGIEVLTPIGNEEAVAKEEAPSIFLLRNDIIVNNCNILHTSVLRRVQLPKEVQEW